jgi:hypothetical protein
LGGYVNWRKILSLIFADADNRYGGIMKIPSTRGLGNLQQLDRAAREQFHSSDAQLLRFTEALIKSQSTISRRLLNISHNKDIRRQIIDFMI